MTKGEKILLGWYGGLEITRIDGSADHGREDVLQALLEQRPVVVRNLIDHWPALKSWTFDGFTERYGGIFTNVFANGKEGESSQMRLRNMKARMDAGEILYSSLYTKELLPLVAPDYPLDGLFIGDPAFNWLLELPAYIHGEMNVIFIGNRGTGIKNHLDGMGTHLWSAQITGRKRWLISPPEMSPYLGDGNIDWMDRDNSIKIHPAFAEAACLDFVLEPEEILILPTGGWWHQTVIIENSISITHDLMNASNIRSYIHALAVEHTTGDPKVALFYEESKPYSAGWKDRLPVRRTREIRRVDGRDLAFEDFLRDFLIPREAVVIENLIDDWPALSKWNMDYLKTHYGRVFIQYFKSRDDQNKRMRIKNFLETDFDAPHYAMWCLDDFYGNYIHS
uniref:Cupin-like domain-containing protein n=1 Tax=Candidatus Kentrum sp. TUN TaxID=2126343 RepID=A0A451ADP8_9GAMM|nr:MAG: Cupin-like domain-containing protein [Candidatus Kentron sp. TUN]